MSYENNQKEKKDYSHTQCMPRDKATALALILEAKISGRRSAGTGPAPRENDNTYL